MADHGTRTSLLDLPVDGHAVLLQRINDLERQRDRHIKRLAVMRRSRDLWRLRCAQRGALVGKATRGSR